MEHLTLLGITALFGLLYAFTDAWHDEKVIRQEKKWHFVDAIIKGLVSFYAGIIVYWFTKDVILSGIVFFGILLIRASVFNWILNKLMDWPKDARRKKGFDRIPNWVWWILLIGLIVFSIIKYN